MSNYDVAVGLTGAVIQQALGVVYSKLYPSVFKGATSTTVAGKPVEVSWDVQAAPTLVFRPPAAGAALMIPHLAAHGYVPPAGLTHDDIATMLLGVLTEANVFQVCFDPVVIQTTGSAPVKAPITVVVELNVANNTVTFHPLTATADPSNPIDKLILNAVILPQVLAMAQTLLSGISIPSPSVEGVTLGPVNAAIQDGRLVMLANLAGKPSPAVPADEWPGTPFFAAVSSDACLAVARAATAGVSKSMTTGGSVGSSLGGASYNASATMSGIGVAPGGDSTSLRLSANLSGSASASVKVACVPVGVSYDLSAQPAPSAMVSLAIGGDGASVQATVGSLSPFVIVLSPSGSVMEKVLSAVTEPIAQAIGAVFPPIITSTLGSIGFRLWTVPRIPINVRGVSLTIHPTQLVLGSVAGALLVSGQLAMS